VTVLFCDVVDSTGRGERIDPESVRRVMSRYFEEMRAALEAHGGTVEKFIGDAVMAVFGVPTAHEDDALRAVRAAAEMQSRLAGLNEELAEAWGVQLAIRIGINTGEVVAGDPRTRQTIVTGDVVNVAKRLEQAAEAGGALISNATYRLVQGAVRADPVRTLEVKGKRNRISAWRLHEVDRTAAGVPRTFDTAFVGRERELALLLEALERVEAERACRLFTVLGSAGLGKSRLGCELAATAGDRTTFLTGRCLPYGEGITFWPLGEIVREAGGESPIRAALEGSSDAELVLERVLGALGSAGTSSAGEETFWAIRKLFEALARPRPLVVCFEDIHWAEPTFLDLIEYLTGWIRDAPVLLLCLARPDLVERQPAWLAPRANVDALVLEPLSEAESEALVVEVGEDLLPETRARIAAAAEGNPLFVEQMAAMAAEEGLGEALAVPPSIQALLAARLDRLDPDERAVIERAAVVGRGFWVGAVRDLAPPEIRESVGAHLMALVRKELIRPDVSTFDREDAFRFKHVLIRDAAYDGMPKELRAELHERFAGWLEEHAAGHASELEEIVGYHIEQAYRLRAELGPVSEPERRLASRAAEILGRAGQRAYSRSDMPAAINLLDRALALLTDQDPVSLELQRELSSALWSAGELARAESLLEGLAEAASAAGDQRQEWYAILERSARGSASAAAAAAPAELLEVAERAIVAFGDLGDELGLARAWRRVSLAHRLSSRYGPAAEAADRSLQHAANAGDPQEHARAADLLCTSLLYGPAAAEGAISRCERLRADTPKTPLLDANVLSSVAGLEAMCGRVERARALCMDAASIYEELGLLLPLAGLSQVAGAVELGAGDAAAAETWLRRGLEILRPVAPAGLQCGLLAEALYEQGRYDEAEPVVETARELAFPSEASSQVLWRTVAAKLAARHGKVGHAEELARAAVDIAAGTDAVNLHGDALVAFAAVLRVDDRDDEAEAALADAAALYRRKGNVLALGRLASGLAHSGR